METPCEHGDIGCARLRASLCGSQDANVCDWLVVGARAGARERERQKGVPEQQTVACARVCVCARSDPPASQLTQDQCPTISVLGLRGSEV